MITPLEQKVLNSINMDELIEFLCELIAVPSVNGTDQENSAQKCVAEKLTQLGMDVDCWELDFDAMRHHPAYSAEVERTHGLGVAGAMGSSKGKSLILNGHIDVVPVDDLSYWHTSPWQGTLKDGRVYGRGALDMKGGLCCAIFAAKAIRDAGVNLKGRLLIESVIGEEDGGSGTLGAILRGYKADAAVIMEPTRLALAPAQAGALNFRVIIEGKTAHGSIRDEGVSAIEKFILIHNALLRFEADRNRKIESEYFKADALPFCLNIGNVKGGTWASNVPESLVFEGRYGIAPGEDSDTARRDFEDTVYQAAMRDPWLTNHLPKVEWWGAQFLPAGTALDDPIVSCVRDAFADTNGQEPVLKGMPFGADMRLLVNQADTPTLLFGPGDIRNAHMPNEFVPVEDLLQVTRTLALTALRFCETE